MAGLQSPPQKPPAQAGSSSLELGLEDLEPGSGAGDEPTPHRGRKPKGMDPRFLPECEFCKGRFKNLSGHLEKCPRKPKPSPPPEPTKVTVELSADSLAILIAGGGDIMAAKRGEHWRLDPLEADALGMGWKQVLDAYYPDLSRSKAGILVIALVQTWAVLQPRLKRDAAQPQRTSLHRAGRNGKDEPAPGPAESVDTGSVL